MEEIFELTHSDFTSSIQYARGYSTKSPELKFVIGDEGKRTPLTQTKEWTTWEPFNTFKEEERKYINYRNIMPNEIVFDLESQEEHDKIIPVLEKENYYFSDWKTGGKGYHAHLFFDRELSINEKKKFMRYIANKTGITLLDESSKGGMGNGRVIGLELSPHRKTWVKKTLLKDNDGFKVNRFPENIPDEKTKEFSKKNYPAPPELCIGLKYSLENKVPEGGRHNYLSVNLSIATKILPEKQREEIRKQYQSIQEMGEGEIAGWDNEKYSNYSGIAVHHYFQKIGLEEIVKNCDCTNKKYLKERKWLEEIEESKNEKGIPQLSGRTLVQEYAEWKMYWQKQVYVIEYEKLYSYNNIEEKYEENEPFLRNEIQLDLEQYATPQVVNAIITKICETNPRRINDLEEEKKNYIPLENGLYDLEKMELIPTSPNYFVTKKLPVRFDPNQSCEKIMEFIKTIAGGDELNEEMLHSFAALPLLRHTTFKGFGMLVGAPDAGKSQWINLVISLYGNELCMTKSLQEVLERPDYRIQLINAWINVQADISDEKLTRKHQSQMKTLTGGDRISGRPLYGVSVDFWNHCKMFWACNRLPKVESGDDAFWNRTHVIEFKKSIPVEDRVEDYWKIISTPEERSGYFNIMIEYALKIKNNRMKVIELSTEEKREKWESLTENADRFFIEATNTGERTSEISKSLFYEYYVKWCNRENIPPISETPFWRDYFWPVFKGEVRDVRPWLMGAGGVEYKGDHVLRGIQIHEDVKQELDKRV